MKKTAFILSLVALLLTLVSCNNKKKDIIGSYYGGYTEITETKFIEYLTTDKKEKVEYDYKWITDDIIEVIKYKTAFYYYYDSGYLILVTGYVSPKEEAKQE